MARIEADRKIKDKRSQLDNEALSGSGYHANGLDANGSVMVSNHKPRVEGVKSGEKEPSAFTKAHPPKFTRLPSQFDGVLRALKTWRANKRLVADPSGRK